MLDDLISRYLSTLTRNCESTESIQADLPVALPLEVIHGIIETSANFLMTKWASERKGVRTAVAMAIVPDYPLEVLEVSLLLDAVVNLFDDLIDENLTKQEKNLLVLELLRALALLNSAQLSHSLRKQIDLYFNKGITIAISEQESYARIQAARNIEEQVNIAVESYLTRGLVADIFFELPLMWQWGTDIDFRQVLYLARVDRALTLLEKDWQDVDHDIANNTHTPVTLLCHEGNEYTCLESMAENLRALGARTDTQVHPALRVVVKRLRQRIKGERSFEQHNSKMR